MAAEYWAEETGAAPQPEAHNYCLSLALVSVFISHLHTQTHTHAHKHAYAYTRVINPTNWNSTHLRRDFSAQNTNSIRRASTPSLSAGKMDHLWALQATSWWHCLRFILKAFVNCILNLSSVFEKLFLFLLQTSVYSYETKLLIEAKFSCFCIWWE